ncbi:MAG: hypothetical protein WBA74_13615 [Cyclobacteriaceae bacterium]
MDRKDRTELKEYFRATKKPTEKQFAEFIEATINQADDGIVKLPTQPVAIKAEGDIAGTQEILHLYTDFSQESPSWSLNLNPRTESGDPASNKNGFNINDATGQSRMFIKYGDGNVGIGTIEPSAPLTIKGNSAAGLPDNPMEIAADRITFGAQTTDAEDSATIEIEEDSFTFYGKAESDGTNRKMSFVSEGGLDVKGSVKIEGKLQAENIAEEEDLGSDNASDDKLPTQKAVKSYIDNRLPKGLISMWSGTTAPEGWVICDGENGTPNLSGRFIVGYDPDQADYSDSGKTGGANLVALTVDEMPEHTHTGKTDKAGIHKHSFTGARKSGDGSGSFSDNDYYAPQTRETANAGEHIHSFVTDKNGSGAPHENRPPYYVLAFIMKL